MIDTISHRSINLETTDASNNLGITIVSPNIETNGGGVTHTMHNLIAAFDGRTAFSIHANTGC